MSFADRLPPRLALYWRLTRLDKPIGTLLLLLANAVCIVDRYVRRPAWCSVAIFTLGTLLMRSRRLRRQRCRRSPIRCARSSAPRTASSPRGRRDPREALAVAAVSGAGRGAAVAAAAPGGMAACVWSLQRSPRTYPLVKRFFPMPQAYLSIAFSFGIPMAFAAVLGQVPAARLVAVHRQPVLGRGLRHRVRDGRSRRRRPHRRPLLGRSSSAAPTSRRSWRATAFSSRLAAGRQPAAARRGRSTPAGPSRCCVRSITTA